jgi:hypothetical protein
MNTDVVVIPGRMTSQLLLLNVVVNKPLSDNLRQLQLYNKWLLGEDHTLNPGGRIQKPCVTLLCQQSITS